MKKPSRKTLKAKADRLFSLRVRARGVCELRGKDDIKCGGNLQCAHIASRRYHSVRWDEDNALCLCQAHHMSYTHRPEYWYKKIDAEFPGRWEEILGRIQKPWDKDLQRVVEELT